MCVALVATIVVITPTAHAGPPVSQASPGVQSASTPYCNIVIAPLKPGEEYSKTISKQCATDKSDLVTPQASYQLMTWFEHANFTGASTRIYGSAPCDFAGYRINNVANAWNDRISSFYGWNWCNIVQAHEHANLTGYSQWWGSFVSWVGASYVGDRLDNRISSFSIWNGS
jgi:hypothetical protein